MSNTTTGTTGYTTYDIQFVRSNLVGGVLVGVIYGMVLILYIQCMRNLWRIRKTRKNAYLLMAHSTVVFILNTLFCASADRVLELTFIDNDDFPGGPFSWLSLETYIPVDVLGTITFCIVNWMLDALMLWRCVIIWSGSRAKYIIIFPTLVFLGCFIAGARGLAILCQPNKNFWSNAGVQAVLPYYILSLSLNIILTISLVLRLFLYRRKVRAELGKEHEEPYTSLGAFIIESAAPYAILSAVYLILVIINNPVQQALLGVLSGAQIIASYLIILRVAHGIAWSNETSLTTFSATATSPSSNNHTKQITFRVPQNNSTSTSIILDTTFKPSSENIGQGAVMEYCNEV